MYGYMWSHPRKNFFYMGGEFGQWHEWNCNESLQREGSHKRASSANPLWPILNALYHTREPALHQVDFDAHQLRVGRLPQLAGQPAGLRAGKAKEPQRYLIALLQLHAGAADHYKIGVPEACWFEEVSNSNSTFYGGSDLGNGGGIPSPAPRKPRPPASMEVSLPPVRHGMFQTAAIIGGPCRFQPLIKNGAVLAAAATPLRNRERRKLRPNAIRRNLLE